MTTYQTQPLTIVDQPTQTIQVQVQQPVEPDEPAAVDHEGPATAQEMVYLVFSGLGQLHRMFFDAVSAEAVCDDRKGVMIAAPVVRDSRTQDPQDLPAAEAARKAVVARAVLGEPLNTAA